MIRKRKEELQFFQKNTSVMHDDIKINIVDTQDMQTLEEKLKEY